MQQALRRGEKGPADEGGGLCRGGQQVLWRGRKALRMSAAGAAEEGSRALPMGEEGCAAGATEGGEGPCDEGGGLCRGGQQVLRRGEKGPADEGGGLCRGGQQALRRGEKCPADEGGHFVFRFLSRLKDSIADL